MDESPISHLESPRPNLVLVPLDEAVKRVWVINAVIGALFTTAFFASIEFIFLRRISWWPEPVLTVGWLILTMTYGLSMIRRRFASWRYGLDEYALTVEFGVWNRHRESIPRARIQHVEIDEGPWDRRFGIRQLSVHTAGTHSVTIPGLTPNEADRLRNELIVSAATTPPSRFEPDAGNLLQP